MDWAKYKSLLSSVRPSSCQGESQSEVGVTTTILLKASSLSLYCSHSFSTTIFIIIILNNSLFLCTMLFSCSLRYDQAAWLIGLDI